MKKIDAILKGRKFTDKLFGLKKRKINRALESAKDNAEKQKEDATIAYEEQFSKMAAADPDFPTSYALVPVKSFPCGDDPAFALLLATELLEKLNEK